MNECQPAGWQVGPNKAAQIRMTEKYFAATPYCFGKLYGPEN
jgi:hypothetical protein